MIMQITNPADRSADPQPPLILFDGVCNLCNGAVQWILQRDRRRAFRFASLQSTAARNALEQAGASLDQLPDSVVLIDEAGVHTRSTAALRIARHLGLPYSAAAALGWLMPQAIRDILYSWIARNRYQWFGRQNACMVPTPGLRARFLDADEPPKAAPPDAADIAPLDIPAAPARPATLSSAVGSLLHRFLLVYLLLYIAPFPLDTIPWLGQTPAIAAYETGKREIVTTIAQQVFGKKITIFPAGSGDTTYNYIELFCYASAAACAALLWTLAVRARPVAPRTRDVSHILVRYYLAMFMLSYGWHKVWPIQMPAPGPDRWLNPLGETSPMGLLWTFMGASLPYQIFGGLGEVLGGMLLLSRRTTLLGALVCFGVMTNVVMLNFCFDVPVKLFSSHLLLCATFLIVPHLPRLAALLFANLPAQPVMLRPFPAPWPWLKWTMRAAKLGFVVLFAILPPIQNYSMMFLYGPYAEKKPWCGVYRVESFKKGLVSDRALPDAERWVRVSFSSFGVGTVQFADGTTSRRLFIDGEKKQVSFPSKGPLSPAVYNYDSPEPGVYVLKQTTWGLSHEIRLRRIDDYKPLLTTRGFHWINEYPLNR
ncbi:MAG: DCC1-like thiol-disulfide oxidoreductase family protein [Phycisphaerae bacterium]|nr:DCC1-like thiol-disulfide oxidoreductase family protein [Phycisphaerae bacterium]